MTDELAHSARDGRPPQTYQQHVEGVCVRTARYAAEAGQYAPNACEPLQAIVRDAAIAHDLGKLEDENQAVLHQPEGRAHLPVHHQDAGAAWLVQANALLAAFLVRCHHQGLCDLTDESTEDKPFCRDEDAWTRERTDQTLDQLTGRHRQALPLPEPLPPEEVPGDMQVFLRMAFSCLSDADHTDTATHYGKYPAEEAIPALRPRERLEQLDHYVETLAAKAIPMSRAEKARNDLRREMYFHCRNQQNSNGFAACDSPVGSGKTTAVMAHLLQQAIVRNARRVFVVLPYTSVISQSVRVYREALVLPGENPERVVAELHYRADFQDVDTRCLTALWRAPVVVTTAVAFFETLASNRPSALRRLHELPGSILLVDEAHGALPTRLLPVAWHWMNVLATEWGCYWVLASGSLMRFWQLEVFARERPVVAELVGESMRNRLMEYERHRVTFRWCDVPKGRKALVAWVAAHPGPRLAIVNTVQNAAVLANDFRRAFGRERVEHLSTALTSEDREQTIDRILDRLNHPKDSDWTLVATSCVEAGVDFSFRTGFREVASLASLLQTAGRVNRHGESQSADVWSFVLQDDPMLAPHPALQAAIRVLTRYLRGGTSITPALSTSAMQAELNESDHGLRNAGDLLRQEMAGSFRTVARDFAVIDSDTVVLIPEAALVTQIRAGQADWRMLQRKGISIPRARARKLHLEELANDIFRWDRAYDGFLGYMAGMVDDDGGC